MARSVKVSPKARAKRAKSTRKLDELELRLAEAEETLNAIRSGAVDALVVHSPRGEQVYTLTTADRSYRVMVESLSEGVVTLTPQGYILYANTRFCQLVALPIERVQGGDVRQFIPAPHLSLFQALLAQGLEAESSGEIELNGADSRRIPVYLSINALGVDQAEGAQLLVTDLSEQKRTREVVEAEELSRSILEQAAQAIVVVDRTGRILRASAAAALLASHNPVSRPFESVFDLQLEQDPAPEGSHRRPSLVERALGGEIIKSAEGILKQTSGDKAHVLLSARPLCGKEGEVIGCTISLVDISESRRAAAEREALLASEQEARQTAEDALKLRDRFLSLAAHELRTPLTSAVGYAELLKERQTERPDISDAERRMLTVVHKQLIRLNGMISELMDVTRIQRAGLPLTRASFDLPLLVAGVADQYRPVLRKHTIVFESDTDSLMFQGDETRLRQVLENLIENAIKYSPRGGLISLTLSHDDHHAHVAVIDPGIGIPEDALPHIFTRFFRARNTEEFHIGGMGIGLYITREIVRAHGGEIQVDSRQNSGTTFTIHLPFTQ